jgi:hypothetical protein
VTIEAQDELGIVEEGRSRAVGILVFSSQSIAQRRQGLLAFTRKPGQARRALAVRFGDLTGIRMVAQQLVQQRERRCGLGRCCLALQIERLNTQVLRLVEGAT